MSPAERAWESGLASYRSQGREHVRHYRLAGIPAEIRCPDRGLLELVTRPFEHLKDDSLEAAALSVKLWSDPDWRPPWKEGDQVPRGLLPQWCSSEITAAHCGTLTASLVNLARGSALHWVRRPEELSHELSSPMLALLYLFFREHGLQLLHGAALGLGGEGFLLLGPGQAGKSTLALDALGQLEFAGDDYVLVDPEGPTAFSLYRTLKVRGEEVRWLDSGLAHSLRLRAAVLCGPGDEPALTRCSRAQLLAGTAPGSLMLFPDAGQDDLARLARILAPLDCYRLSRGPRGAGRVQVLRSLLERDRCAG